MTTLITPLTEVKASPLFIWDNAVKRFRKRGSQRFISFDDVETLRDEYIEQERAINDDLARRLFNKEITIRQWVDEMQGNIRRVSSIMYMIGRGGRFQMTQRDWGILGQYLRGQYGFINRFAQDIINGRYTTEQEAVVAGRMFLYDLKAKEMYERGNLEKYQDDDQKVMWEYLPEKLHCSDCLERHGKVFLVSELIRTGVWPRSSRLACLGIWCGCRVRPV